MSTKQTPLRPLAPSNPAKRKRVKATAVSIVPSLEDSISAVRKLAQNIQSRHRKNCEEAVLAGMHLAHLKDEFGTTHGGDRRSLAAQSTSFASILEDNNIPRKSAYRWMGKARELAVALGILSTKPEEQAEQPFPLPGSKDWQTIEAAAKQWAETTSIERLQVGATADDPDEQRLEHLMSKAEAGDPDALRYLERVRAGDMTLALAVRAYGGAAATKGKVRHDPVYLVFDSCNKRPAGLIPKALVALRNGFANWETYDEDARKATAAYWEEVLKAAPSELTEPLRQILLRK